MNSTRIFTALLAIMVMACDNQNTDLQPEVEENTIRLTRVEFTHEQTGETSVTDYTYEDGFLSTEQSEGYLISFYYKDGVLDKKVRESDNEYTDTSTYTYEADKITITKETINPLGNSGVSIYEYVSVSEDLMRINYYRLNNGQQSFRGHSICTIENGNITSEVSYDLQGEVEERSNESIFGTGLNPYSLWKGHPQLQSKNLAVNVKYYLLKEPYSEIFREEVQLNEHDLPTELLYTWEGSGRNVYRVKFTYEE